jgi:hypothetical protein
MTKSARFLQFKVLVGLFAFLCVMPDQARSQMVVEPRSKVEALSFRCLDEDWVDRLSSDEIIVTIHDPERRVATLSRIFGSVDRGDEESFEPGENCILPIAGLSGPDIFLAAAHET